MARLPVLLLLVLALPAAAQDDAGSRAASGAFPAGFDQVIYKGVVGNMLEIVPMNASDRVTLQRANAVVSNTLIGRSLAVMAGLSNPLLLLGGIVWGVWSATNIRPAEAGIRLAANPDAVQFGGAVVVAEHALAPPYRSSAADGAPANKLHEPMLVSSLSAAAPEVAVHTQAHVFKVWLPQRSPVLSQ